MQCHWHTPIKISKHKPSIADLWAINPALFGLGQMESLRKYSMMRWFSEGKQPLALERTKLEQHFLQSCLCSAVQYCLGRWHHLFNLMLLRGYGEFSSSYGPFSIFVVGDNVQSCLATQNKTNRIRLRSWVLRRIPNFVTLLKAAMAPPNASDYYKWL